MDTNKLSVLFLTLLLVRDHLLCVRGDGFDNNYKITWGFGHVVRIGNQVELWMDKSSGAGFESKQTYGSGFFQMRIKLPNKDSAGVVTAFYLNSDGDHHDELDFEFLGNREGKPITLQTNVFANGVGNREQRIFLWFDPTADFHTYGILLNHHQIVFYVDNTPIRVFKNHRRIKVPYPSEPMKLQVSLWDGDSWATDGGRTKTDWSHAPFIAYFQDFNINGCAADRSNIKHCYSGRRFWWNENKYWRLTTSQQREYQKVKKYHMYYDYCTDKLRYPNPPPECQTQ